MRATRLLFLRQIRRRPLRTIIAVVSVAAGVSMVLCIATVVGSLQRSVEEQAAFLAGPAPLRVVGPIARGGIEPEVLDRVRGTDGVSLAVPTIQAITMLERRSGSGEVELEREIAVLGVDCATGAILGDEVCDRPDGAILVGGALDRRLRSLPDGEQLAVRTATGRLALDDVVAVEALDVYNAGTVAVLPIEQAQQVFERHGTVDVVYVLPDEGTLVATLQQRLDRRLGPHLAVLASTDPPPILNQMTATIVPFFGLLALLALGVGFVLIGNTVALSLEERRRELAVVAAIGATDRALLGAALAHATVLGVAGGLLGVLGGIALAYPITSSLTSFTHRLLGIEVVVHPQTAPYLFAVVLGAAVAVMASWRPSRRALRIDVAAEISGRELRAESSTRSLVRRPLIAAGIGLVGLAMASLGSRNGGIEQWQLPVALIGMLIGIVGFTVAGGATAPLLLRAVLRSRVPLPATIRLATGNLVRDPRRTGVMAVAIGIAIGTAFMAGSFASAAETGIRQGVTDGLGDRIQVSAGTSNNTVSLDARLPDGVLRGLAAHPDVAAVHRSAAVLAGHDDIIGIVGMEGWGTPNEVYDGTAERRAFERGEVLIGAGLARREGVHAGDTIELPGIHGLVDVPIQGIWGNGDFNGNGVWMPLSMLEELYGPQVSTQVLVEPAAGVAPGELVRALEPHVVAPPYQALTPDALASDIADAVKAQMAPFWVVQRALTLVAFVAVLTTLLLTGIQRRRELGVLAAVGMEPQAMRRMVLAEGGVVCAAATLLSCVGSVAMYKPLHDVSPLLVGWASPFTIAWWTVPVYGFLSLLVVLLAAAIPAWRTSRVPVVEALAYE